MLKQFRVSDDVAVRIESSVMRQTVNEIFRALGMPHDDAQRCVDTLMYADDRGIDSHGVSNMVRFYVAGLKDGSINPAPKMTVTRDFPGAAVVDSDKGLGLTIGPQAMDLAIEKARVCGVATVTAMNGGHFGAAAYHAQLALAQDMIGLSMTVGGLMVAPTFGAEARVGLNPIAIAAPAGEEAPFVFDGSMSSVAGNKIRLAQRLGADILPGWVTEADGTPVMDERPTPDGFMMLPLGGTREIGSHKGYGLGAAVDILSGLLSGAGVALHRKDGTSGHHFTVFNIAAFRDLDEYRTEMDAYLRALRETRPAPGQKRVLYAGLEEHEEEIERRERGIPYHPEVIDWFRETTSELGLADHFA